MSFVNFYKKSFIALDAVNRQKFNTNYFTVAVLLSERKYVQCHKEFERGRGNL